MRSGRQRLAIGAGLLAALWIGVYWAWPVDRQPAITFADEPLHEEIVEPLTEAPAPAPAPVVIVPPPQNTPAKAPEPQRVGVVEPVFTMHTVRAGETFQSIARKAYGSAALWSVVARANPKVDPQKLRAGQEIRLPVDPNNVQGLTVGDPGAATTARSTQAIEYVVHPGDTLGGIAKTYYNSSALWEVILDANRSLISRPQDLRPGMKLMIPPDPRGATGSGGGR